MRGRRSPRIVQAALSASFEYANGGVQNFLWILAGAHIFLVAHKPKITGKIVYSSHMWLFSFSCVSHRSSLIGRLGANQGLRDSVFWEALGEFDLPYVLTKRWHARVDTQNTLGRRARARTKRVSWRSRHGVIVISDR